MVVEFLEGEKVMEFVVEVEVAVAVEVEVERKGLP